MSRLTLLSALTASSLLALAACSSSSEDGSADLAGAGAGSPGTSTGTGDGYGDASASAGTGDYDGGGDGESAAPDGSSGAGLGAGGGGGAGGQAPTPEPGQLTAGDWDDNLNFGLFQDYRSTVLQDGSQTHGSFVSADRVVITVTNAEGDPIPSARVTVSGGGSTFLSAPTASDGRVLFFPTEDGAAQAASLTLKIDAPPGQNLPDVVMPAPAGTEWTVVLPGATKVLPPALDIAFVVDATGSMSDEIEYLKVEVQNIADAVHDDFGNVDTRYSLIVYRDAGQGDEYVTRTFDFTSSLATFKASLDDQSAGGGGDYPEAMDLAMQEMVGLDWRPGNVARLAFLIADAPPHEEHEADFLDRANDARLLGIKMYPVAASGVASEAEYLMRSAAESTLGRYLFITDDSGIGESHEEPHIPCYQVQLLNGLLQRMIASELSGTRVPAAPAEVIRSVGDPVDGVCTLADGEEAYF